MKRYTITVNGVPYDVAVEEAAPGAAPLPSAAAVPTAAAAAPAAAAAAPATTPAAATPTAGAGTKVLAPMPGNILDVKVNVGDAVKEGDLVVLLEAMKMENEIFANASGKVTSVLVKKGDAVNSDDALITIG